jgi:hypothetical protein
MGNEHVSHEMLPSNIAGISSCGFHMLNIISTIALMIPLKFGNIQHILGGGGKEFV